MNKESTKKLRVRLYRAIENKNSTPEQIRKLIAEGALKTLTDEEEEHFRRSPLYIAAQTGRVDLVQLLLDAGVDVVDFVDDGRSRRGPCTALSVAALWGYTDVAVLCCLCRQCRYHSAAAGSRCGGRLSSDVAFESVAKADAALKGKFSHIFDH